MWYIIVKNIAVLFKVFFLMQEGTRCGALNDIDDPTLHLGDMSSITHKAFGLRFQYSTELAGI